ncbi:MAG: hypothetical protein M0R17_03010 [Candidatus Omnitrophica bacterium]|jgi:hypothetical protein|nr:hypothetical protein [Candidatus Omnitrophota bacterium]
MKVKIIKCSNKDSWYKNNINDVTPIKNINTHECYYELKHLIACIPKCDCILINENNYKTINLRRD